MHRSVAINQAHGFWPTLKRTIFMASLYFRLIRDYDPDENILKEFNQIFYLVIDPKSLSFPAMICPLLWREKTIHDVVELCDQGEFKKAVEIIYGRIPKFLRYLDRETMVRDAERVILRTQKIRHA
jgi:hypothetical protein